MMNTRAAPSMGTKMEDGFLARRILVPVICRETRPRKLGLFTKGPFYATLCLLGAAVLYCAMSQNNLHPQQPPVQALATVAHHSVRKIISTASDPFESVQGFPCTVFRPFTRQEAAAMILRALRACL